MDNNTKVMTIEQQALALVNEGVSNGYYTDLNVAPYSSITRALCRALERHEAFRQEVSEACAGVIRHVGAFRAALAAHGLQITGVET